MKKNKEQKVTYIHGFIFEVGVVQTWIELTLIQGATLPMRILSPNRHPKQLSFGVDLQELRRCIEHVWPVS